MTSSASTPADSDDDQILRQQIDAKRTATPNLQDSLILKEVLGDDFSLFRDLSSFSLEFFFEEKMPPGELRLDDQRPARQVHLLPLRPWQPRLHPKSPQM